MKKRILALGTAAVLALSLTACGSSQKAETTAAAGSAAADTTAASGEKTVIKLGVVGENNEQWQPVIEKLAEDYGLIEAAESMGNSPWEIIFRVYLKESVPGIVRAMQITFISLVGLTAMAGAVGGGGLGDFAIRYGHSRGQTDVTYVTVIIILIMVSLIQSTGSYVIKKTTH